MSRAVVAQVVSYESVPSTMDIAIAAAESGAAEGLVIVAHEQTAGRGRRGRAWSSPDAAGLYLSLVLRPPRDDSGSVIPLLTLAAGVGVHDALRVSTGIDTHLKWPNDVMVGRRKLAGILAEGLRIGSEEQAVVLGIGINLRRAVHPPDVASRATSVEEEGGGEVGRAAVQDAVVESLLNAYERLRHGGASDILRAWSARAHTAKGARVEWDTARGVCSGTTAGIDDSGALLVHTPTAIERVVGGELRWL